MRARQIRSLDTELAESSLVAYVRQAWHVLEPSTDYVHGWHVDVICEHLEAVTVGQIKSLIINVPPGMMKSLLVSVFWPTWDWIKNPHRRYLTAAYAQTLSTRDSVKSRRLIQSMWYQERWGHKYTLLVDQNQKTRYENDKSGLRVALSVGGAVTGERGDVRILDDPQNADSVKSNTQRENTLEWIQTVWPTRKMSKDSAEVVIMQRLHERDVTGYLLSEIGGYEHLVFPMRFEGVSCVTVLGNADRRSGEELLCPERYDETEVASLEKQLGSDAPGQLQQRPTSAAGGIFKKVWWDVAEGINRYDLNDTAIRSKVIARWLTFDTAFKDKSHNDPSACCVWELWSDYRLAVRSMWQERIESAFLPGKIEELSKRWNQDGKLRAVIIEDKGSGITSIQTLRMSAPSWLAEMIIEFQPTGAKEYRARLSSVWCERGCIQLPWPADDAEWYSDFLDPENGQLWMFPNAAHDDMVDTFTMGIQYLEHYIAEGWQARQGKWHH